MDVLAWTDALWIVPVAIGITVLVMVMPDDVAREAMKFAPPPLYRSWREDDRE